MATDLNMERWLDAMDKALARDLAQLRIDDAADALRGMPARPSQAQRDYQYDRNRAKQNNEDYGDNL